ncbi:hypothetical protein D3P08_15415 [Paenibacillus nanensis]|uniref:Uncharacterized protein n=1 Tax=Paenibacillus nanensis TaxID=393251 RepID=A0A3A1UX84_9BACL|nr:hypothetical protein [Paenibacillus nanensis]RIX51802.1 hypothetical protein D3P08_15415 [Paenibacillus nanensis]
MLGTWRWNVAFGILGLALTALFSFGNNPLSVVMLRGFYAFASFFILAYAARAVLAMILRPPAIPLPPGAEEGETEKGSQLDVTTPDEAGELNDLLKAQLQGGNESNPADGQKEAAAEFKPLSPPQFVSSTNKQPEELAKAIRHLTGE